MEVTATQTTPMMQEHLAGPLGPGRQSRMNRDQQSSSHGIPSAKLRNPAQLVGVESQLEEEEEERDAVKSLLQHKPDIVGRKQEPPAIQHGLSLPRRPFKLQTEQLATVPTPAARSQSPYSRAHARSRSSGAAFSTAPAMARAHSSPSPSSSLLTPYHAVQQSNQPQQPPAVLRTPPTRQRSPFGEEYLHPRPRSPHSWEASSLNISSIQEDVALDIPLSRPPVPLSRSGGSLRRSRPASPLHSVTNAVATPTGSFSADGSGSPMLGPIQRYYSNDAYPSGSTASSSSVSSTPTSWMSRSRSPSISSLETIEDAGEEMEMKEAEEVEKLREAADAERRRSSFDGGSGRMRSGSRERKRWSVCGGERRADLDLETIWED